MTARAMSKPQSPPPPEREAWLARLLPLPHRPESMDGIPYFDEAFQMAASHAHRKTIYFLGALLDRVAERAGLRGVSDYPVYPLARPQGEGVGGWPPRAERPRRAGGVFAGFLRTPGFA